VKKALCVLIGCIIILIIVLPDRVEAGAEFSYLWVRVLDSHYNPVSTAKVLARNTANGNYYTLTFQGWGYYNKTLVPGNYDIYVNGRFLRSGVYAGAYWYVIVTCYI